MLQYLTVYTIEEYAAAAKLFSEYAAWLNVDLSFQKFSDELQDLKTMFSTEKGGIVLCKNDSEYIGCVAVRKITNEVAELKRMYVQPAHQNKGVGKKLLEAAIIIAQNCNYKFIRLDTLNTMLPAIHFYKKNGFYTINSYYNNPIETAIYFERKIQV